LNESIKLSECSKAESHKRCSEVRAELRREGITSHLGPKGVVRSQQQHVNMHDSEISARFAVVSEVKFSHEI
jgi:hypothetical protein